MTSSPLLALAFALAFAFALTSLFRSIKALDQPGQPLMPGQKSARGVRGKGKGKGKGANVSDARGSVVDL